MNSSRFFEPDTDRRPCLPERSQYVREASGLAQSRDPYPHGDSLGEHAREGPDCREGHDFNRAEKSPEIPCAPAPAVRRGVAQRFSAAVKPPLLLAALAAEGPRSTLVRTIHALILAAAVFLLVGAGPSNDARFKDLGHRMMCTCGCGQVLLECNHVGCQSSDKMRDQLLASIDKGNNDDLVLQGFVQEYGPTVIAAPTATGFIPYKAGKSLLNEKTPQAIKSLPCHHIRFPAAGHYNDHSP